jgi:diguanylate cyclase (GGDEF)-like protein
MRSLQPYVENAVMTEPAARLAGQYDETVRVLLVEDNPDVGSTLALALRALNSAWQVDLAGCLREALERMESAVDAYDAAIVDLGLPDATSEEAPLIIHSRAPDLPIVVLTGQNSDVAALHLIQSGVQDYVVKGQASPNQVALTVKSAMQRQSLKNQLESAALTDPLTGALNRHGLDTAFERSLGVAQRLQGKVGMLLGDLNKFKGINDTYGHAAGDAVLKSFADAFMTNSRPSDLVARLGGDEFVIVVNGVDTVEQAVQAARRLIGALPPSCSHDDDEIKFSASFGIAVFPDHGKTLHALMKEADTAMYSVKGSESALGIAKQAEDNSTD